MVLDGFDFEIIAEDDPDFLAKMHDVEYLIGFARDQFGPEFYRKLAWQHNNVVASKWRVGDLAEPRLYALAGKTVGIVGLSTIGKRVARRLKGFDVQLQSYDTVRMTEIRQMRLASASSSCPNCCARQTW